MTIDWTSPYYFSARFLNMKSSVPAIIGHNDRRYFIDVDMFPPRTAEKTNQRVYRFPIRSAVSILEYTGEVIFKNFL